MSVCSSFVSGRLLTTDHKLLRPRPFTLGVSLNIGLLRVIKKGGGEASDKLVALAIPVSDSHLQ